MSRGTSAFARKWRRRSKIAPSAASPRTAPKNAKRLDQKERATADGPVLVLIAPGNGDLRRGRQPRSSGECRAVPPRDAAAQQATGGRRLTDGGEPSCCRRSGPATQGE